MGLRTAAQGEPGGREPTVYPFMVVNLFATGAAGLIGSNFVRHWVTAHPDDTVVAFDLLTYAISVSPSSTAERLRGSSRSRTIRRADTA